MYQSSNLKHHFIIAMPGLTDGHFAGSVVYICEHTENGAMGMVINRPSEVQLGEIFDHMAIDCNKVDVRQKPVLYGGPVQEDRGFVIHRSIGQPGGQSKDRTREQWSATLNVNDDVGITSSRDILEAIAQAEGPEDYMVVLGYAGWQAGQLEEEIGANVWLSGPAHTDILFNRLLDERRRAAASLLGINFSNLSYIEGHA